MSAPTKITLKTGDKIISTLNVGGMVNKAVVSAPPVDSTVKGSGVITATTNKKTVALNRDHLALHQVNSAGVSEYIAGI